MIWNKHSNLEGTHAFLGASKCSWLNYDENKLVETFINMKAKERGTRLHAFAAECINLKQKLPKSAKTLNMYVNDAIGFRMTPEQVLYYSEFCYGTADAIRFDNKALRIHDLKTGTTPIHKEQLEIYAALFCLEYHIKPSDIFMELRVYQNNEINVWNPDQEIIFPIMDKIQHYDKILKQLSKEE